jgi:hypothetical protein
VFPLSRKRKKGVFDKTQSLVIILFYVSKLRTFEPAASRWLKMHAKEALTLAFQYSEDGTINVD